MEIRPDHFDGEILNPLLDSFQFPAPKLPVNPLTPNFRGSVVKTPKEKGKWSRRIT